MPSPSHGKLKVIDGLSMTSDFSDKVNG